MKAGLMLGVNPKSIREENDYYATTQFYAWYVFEKGYKYNTVLRWISPKLGEEL